MAVVIGAQEDPGDPVQSLEASNPSAARNDITKPCELPRDKLRVHGTMLDIVP
jgi:hypothetical protein